MASRKPTIRGARLAFRCLVVVLSVSVIPLMLGATGIGHEKPRGGNDALSWFANTDNVSAHTTTTVLQDRDLDVRRAGADIVGLVLVAAIMVAGAVAFEVPRHSRRMLSVLGARGGRSRAPPRSCSI